MNLTAAGAADVGGGTPASFNYGPGAIVNLNKGTNTALTFTVGSDATQTSTTTFNRVGDGTLVVNGSTATSLGSTTGERLIVNGAAPAMQSVQVGAGGGSIVAPYFMYGNASDFLTYTAANGFASAASLYTAHAATFTPAAVNGNGAELANASGTITINAGTVQALRLAGGTFTLGGTLNIGNTGATQSGLFGTGANTVTGGVIHFTGEGYIGGNLNGGISSQVTADAGLHKFGPGNVVFGSPAAANNFGGTLTVDGSGRLFVANQNALGTGPVVLNNGGTLSLSAAFNPTNPITFNPGSNISDRTTGTGVTLTAINGGTPAAGQALFPSAGLMRFNFDDAATGAFTVAGTYPMLTGDMTFAAGGGSTGNGVAGQTTIAAVNSGTAQTLTFTGVSGSSNGAGVVITTLTLANPLTFNTGTAGSVGQVGTLAGGTNAVTKTGPGTVIVANGSTSTVNGAVSIYNGTLQFNASTTAAVLVGNGITISGGALGLGGATDNVTFGANNAANTITVTPAGGTISLNQAGGNGRNTTVANPITLNGPLTIAGNAATGFNGERYYNFTGPFTVQTVTVRSQGLNGNTGAVPPSVRFSGNNAGLTGPGGVAFNVLAPNGATAGGVTFYNAAALGGGGNGSITVAAGAAAGFGYNFTAADLAKFNYASGAILSLGAGVTFTQNLDFSAAGLNKDLRIGAIDSVLATPFGNYTATYSGTITPNTNTYKFGPFASNVVVLPNANQLTGANNLDINTVTPTGAAAYANAGFLRLDAANNFTGTTNVAGAGGLRLTNVNAIASSSGVTLDNGVLDLRSNTAATFNVAAVTTGTANNGTINVDNNGSGTNTTLTASGPITVQSGRTLTVTGGNGYSLGAAQTLTLAGSAATDSVNANVPFFVNAPVAYGTNTLSTSGTSTVVLSQAATGTGSTTVNGVASAQNVVNAPLAISNPNQLGPGNLKLNGTAIVLDNTGGAFNAGLGGRTFGTGANQFQITTLTVAGLSTNTGTGPNGSYLYGGGFAARGNPVTVSSTDTGSTAAFNTNFTLGSTATIPGVSGFYANAPVNLAANTVLTAGTAPALDRYITVAATGPGLTKLTTDPTTVVNQISGNLSVPAPRSSAPTSRATTGRSRKSSCPGRTLGPARRPRTSTAARPRSSLARVPAGCSSAPARATPATTATSSSASTDKAASPTATRARRPTSWPTVTPPGPAPAAAAATCSRGRATPQRPPSTTSTPATNSRSTAWPTPRPARHSGRRSATRRWRTRSSPCSAAARSPSARTCSSATAPSRSARRPPPPAWSRPVRWCSRPPTSPTTARPIRASRRPPRPCPTRRPLRSARSSSTASARWRCRTSSTRWSTGPRPPSAPTSSGRSATARPAPPTCSTGPSARPTARPPTPA